MSAFTKAWSIAALNLRRLFRDRTGSFFVLVFPFLLILALGATFGGAATPSLGVVHGEGPIASDLVARLDAVEALDVERYDDADALRDAVERGVVDGGLIVPLDHDDRVAAGDTAPVSYLARPSTTGTELRATVAAVVDEQGVELAAARFLVAEDLAGSLDEARVSAASAAEDAPDVEVGVRTAGSDRAIGFEQGAAQQLIVFMFVTSLSASSMLIETRRLGVSRRMLASPTRVSTVLLGEALGRFAIALLQGALIVVGTTLLFRVEWGNLVTTVIVVLLFALAGTGAAMLLGSVLRNAAQAGGLGVFLGLVLAALGGGMVPIELFPPTIATIAHVTPHAWAIDALTDGLAGASPVDVAADLTVLAAYAAVLLAVATVVFRRTLTRAG
ncbi:MAG TPA: ABC transporter permease [Actinomycetota bacterium]|nr:ABC transporter permease [Actinomycetota bacterium]